MAVITSPTKPTSVKKTFKNPSHSQWRSHDGPQQHSSCIGNVALDWNDDDDDDAAGLTRDEK